MVSFSQIRVTAIADLSNLCTSCSFGMLVCYDKLQRKTGILRLSLSTITALHSTLRYVDIPVQWYAAVLNDKINFRPNHTITEENDLDVCTLFSLPEHFSWNILIDSSGNSRNISLCSTGTSFRLFICKFHAYVTFASVYLTINKFWRFLFVKISTTWSSKVLKLPKSFWHQ